MSTSLYAVCDKCHEAVATMTSSGGRYMLWLASGAKDAHEKLWQWIELHSEHGLRLITEGQDDNTEAHHRRPDLDEWHHP